MKHRHPSPPPPPTHTHTAPHTHVGGGGWGGGSHQRHRELQLYQKWLKQIQYYTFLPIPKRKAWCPHLPLYNCRGGSCHNYDVCRDKHRSCGISRQSVIGGSSMIDGSCDFFFFFVAMKVVVVAPPAKDVRRIRKH